MVVAMVTKPVASDVERSASTTGPLAHAPLSGLAGDTGILDGESIPDPTPTRPGAGEADREAGGELEERDCDCERDCERRWSRRDCGFRV
jgi:hypothetical protein